MTKKNLAAAFLSRQLDGADRHTSSREKKETRTSKASTLKLIVPKVGPDRRERLKKKGPTNQFYF